MNNDSKVLNKERGKGCPLSERNVLAIAQNCECIAMPLHAKSEVVESRGYSDIDPENAWEEWRLIRDSLTQDL